MNNQKYGLDRDFSQEGNMPNVYHFNEEEETNEDTIITQEETEKDTIIIENDWDLFRPESIFDKDSMNKFLRKSNTDYLQREEYSYSKSDYYFLSHITENERIIKKSNDDLNLIDKLQKFSKEDLLSYSIDKQFFRLFGFLPVEIENNFLARFPKLVIKPLPKVAPKKSNGNKNIIDWIKYLDDLGSKHHILFSIVVFIKENGNDMYGVDTYNVGENNPFNRLFVTLLNEKGKIKLYALQSVAKTIIDSAGKKKDLKETYIFNSVSDQYFLINDVKITNDNTQTKISKYSTINYDIKVEENSKKILHDNIKEKAFQIPSIFKLNFFLKFVDLYSIGEGDKKYFNNFNKHIKYKENEKNKKYDFEQITNDSSKYLSFFRRTTNSKNHEINFDPIKEYRVFVGLRGFQYPDYVASHFSIFSALSLEAIFVDENMERVFCAFAGDGYLKLVEGEVGTQKMDDMLTVLEINGYKKKANANPKFFTDVLNTLYFTYNETFYRQKEGTNKWESVDKKPNEIEISKPTDAKYEMLPEKLDTAPTALEINNKLFLLYKSQQLYHPTWRNCIFKEGIISTFYRFAFHALPDRIVFENNDDIVAAILYPQIDIGFRGKIQTYFASTNVPGIFEYCDRAFNFAPLKSLLPHIKTDFLFFNNGKLKVGLDRHRTKCQLAASALFGFACTIYGPGMRLRDFRFEKDNPLPKDKFTIAHNFLIATYGTLLKMQNEIDFENALDAICDELGINEAKENYYKLMEELKKDYY